MNLAVKLNVLQEKDFMTLSEKQVIQKIENWISTNKAKFYTETEFSIKDDSENLENRFAKYYLTFRNMKKIIHTDQKLQGNNYFSVNLKVKQRFINPLVNSSSHPQYLNKKQDSHCVSIQKPTRLSNISPFAYKIIEDFKNFSDTKFGSVNLFRCFSQQ